MITVGDSVRTLVDLHVENGGGLIRAGVRVDVIGFEGERLIVEDSEHETGTKRHATCERWEVRRERGGDGS